MSLPSTIHLANCAGKQHCTFLLSVHACDVWGEHVCLQVLEKNVVGWSGAPRGCGQGCLALSGPRIGGRPLGMGPGCASMRNPRSPPPRSNLSKSTSIAPPPLPTDPSDLWDLLALRSCIPPPQFAHPQRTHNQGPALQGDPVVEGEPALGMFSYLIKRTCTPKCQKTYSTTNIVYQHRILCSWRTRPPSMDCPSQIHNPAGHTQPAYVSWLSCHTN